MTGDKLYLARVMKLKAPPLPVHGEKENKLFHDLIIEQPGTSPDFDAMAIAWCKHVDCVDVWPKLPVYLSTHYKAWERNQHVRDAAERVAPGAELLTELFAAANERASAVAICNPAPMPADPENSSAQDDVQIVGQTNVGASANALPAPARKRSHGDRGKDARPRKKRRCKTCRRTVGCNGAKAGRGWGPCQFPSHPLPAE